MLPELTRANRNYITILINGRYIKNFLLNRAIFDGYGSKLMVEGLPLLRLLIFRLIPTWLMSMFTQQSRKYVSLKKGAYGLISSAIAPNLRAGFNSDALENLAV